MFYIRSLSLLQLYDMDNLIEAPYKIWLEDIEIAST